MLLLDHTSEGDVRAFFAPPPLQQAMRTALNGIGGHVFHKSE